MDEKIKILHLEDSDRDVELLFAQLDQEGIKFDVVRARNRNEYLNAIESQKFDIIISDNTLPDFDGIDALRYAKKIQPLTPFVFLSGTIGEDTAIEALRWGASDYVLKQKLSKLGPAIKRVWKEYQKELEIQKMNQQIRLSERKFRNLAENLPDIIARYDRNQCYTYINPAATKISGLSITSCIGKNNSEIDLPKEISSVLNKSLYNVFMTSKPQTFELSFRTELGIRIFTFIMVPEIDEAGKIVSVLSVGHDITELKNAEKEIIKAKEAAEEMNKLKTCFLSNMSHELRTPMVAILGFAEMLQSEFKNTEHIELINPIVEGAQRLSNTLNSILELSQLESGKTNLELKPYKISKLIESKVNALLPTAQAKGLYLKTEFLNSNIKSNIDADLFSKMLFNILSNGIKFSKKGGVTVQLANEKNADENWALVKVIDTGVGIPDGQIKNIFCEFRQASEGINRIYEGTGVGLTVSKKIAGLMKGDILVKSEVNKGSVFTIKLPAIMTDDEFDLQVENRKRLTMLEMDEPVKSNKPSVLMVEDNFSNRHITKIFLKDLCMVTEAVDGLSALSFASLNRYDLILMDINLGSGIDGVETMRRIRELHGYKLTPIIALTAYVMSGDREKYLSAGFSDYLPKPFSKEKLIATIKLSLKGKN